MSGSECGSGNGGWVFGSSIRVDPCDSYVFVKEDEEDTRYRDQSDVIQLISMCDLCVLSVIGLFFKQV